MEREEVERLLNLGKKQVEAENFEEFADTAALLMNHLLGGDIGTVLQRAIQEFAEGEAYGDDPIQCRMVEND
jgi:hypothetical protein